MRRCLLFLLVFWGLVVAWACERPAVDRGRTPAGGRDAHSPGGDEVSEGGGICDDAPPLGRQSRDTDSRVAVILGAMTLTEKVAQMAGFPAGGELFATPDNERLNVRGFKFRDGPRGVRLETGTATCFPVAVGRAASWDLELERRVGAAMGAETRGLGHNLLLAPTVNTLRHPGWGRGQETYGEDPWLLGRMGTASVLGIQTHVPACVKHFAGNNIEDTRMTNNAVIEPQTLRENYTRAFEMIVKEADVACVMAAYNKVNGRYCCENEPLLRGLLKGEWAFDGIVLSDWFAAQSTVESALAGLDVEMPWLQHYRNLHHAVDGGQVPLSVIDDAVERILRIKFRFGFAVLDEPFVGDPSVVESAAHTELAREAARKSLVLLQNDGGLLPLDRAQRQRIAVVGRWADEARLGDAGSSAVTPAYAISPFAGIREVAGTDVDVTTSQDASAAAGADVAVVVVALTQREEGEAVFGGGDRRTLDVSADQEDLVIAAAALAPKVIVVIKAGGPVTMERWRMHADAIVMAWYPGMEGGRAIADVLFGDANFEGRVPQTWPRQEEDLPEFGNKQAETVFDYYHGYRHFDYHGLEPLFPFGYGLSYTDFAFANLSLPCAAITPAGELSVELEVENTGAMAGVAVPQLYVSMPDSTARRPVKELKGFARVALAPGERKTVTIPLRIPDLAYFDAARGAFVVERGEYVLHVGPHAGELPLSARFTVAAVGTPVAE
jgi:beta-glucosidase